MINQKLALCVYPWQVYYGEDGKPLAYRRRFWGSHGFLTGVDLTSSGKWRSHHWANSYDRLIYNTAEEAMAANDEYQIQRGYYLIPENEIDKYLGLETLK